MGNTSHSGRRRILALSLFIGFSVSQAASLKPGEPVTEDQARAGFLFQIAQYVEWPASIFPVESSPVRFCVLGQDALISKLESTVRGKSIQGHSIVVMRVRDVSHLNGCQVAFIGQMGEKQLHELFTGWPYPPVLLIGEASQFAEMGGMVNLTLANGRVSFELNTVTAERAGLVFRSQLLRFAKVVTDRRAAQ